MSSVETMPSPALVRDCVNTIRTLAIDATNAAKSGHPGAPMGFADAAFVLWTDVLRFNPQDPKWPGRDRFVLSGGHASMLLYSMLHLTGYDLSLDEIKNFRQWGSKTPGHPEYGLTPGVEITTGPLGSGFASAVGMALAAQMAEVKYATPEFNPVPGRVYVECGDGDMMEGVASEAAAYAGHLGLGKLIVLYDCNRISIDGSTDLTFTENVGERFRAYGWRVQDVDGTDHDAIRDAIRVAQEEVDHPSLIVTRTTIGYGSPGVGGTSKAHGNPLGADEAVRTKEVYGWPTDELFRVPQSVRDYFDSLTPARLDAYAQWQDGLAAWRKNNPGLAEEWDAAWNKEVPDGLVDAALASVDNTAAATRALGGKVIQALAANVSDFVGGCADLTGSTSTWIEDAPPVGADAAAPVEERFRGRNFHFGVREFGMGCVVNGLNLYGCYRAFGATFLVFSDYMRPALRLAALMDLPSITVFTHDSVYVGEDGPTHQPVEQVGALRAIPNLNVFRPGTQTEVAMSWVHALEETTRPSCLVLTRQGIPDIPHPAGLDPAIVRRGGYVLDDCDGEPALVIVATGSEVGTSLSAAALLRKDGHRIRVVSMPCVELYEAQDAEYRESVVPPQVKICAVEAGRSREWYWLTGRDGLIIGIDRFGASAPGNRVAAELGFTPEAIADRIRTTLF